MTIQFTNNNGDATITLCGRLDTSVSAKTKSEIDKLLDVTELYEITIEHMSGKVVEEK